MAAQGAGRHAVGGHFGQAGDLVGTPFGHAYLEHPTPQETALFDEYADGSFPFVDTGNQYLVPEAQYLSSDLHSMSWSQVAAAMRTPSSTVARDIDGAANIITAAVCGITNG
jgi:hypothetical protein